MKTIRKISNKYSIKAMACIVFMAALGGCMMAPSVGSAPGKNAPKLIIDKDSGRPAWDGYSSFGPVPKDLQEVGDATCAAVDSNLKAIGYHPLAMDLNGNKLPAGGYYCFYKRGNKK